MKKNDNKLVIGYCIVIICPCKLYNVETFMLVKMNAIYSKRLWFRKNQRKKPINMEKTHQSDTNGSVHSIENELKKNRY